jgi:hypothetical protein
MNLTTLFRYHFVSQFILDFGQYKIDVVLVPDLS